MTDRYPLAIVAARLAGRLAAAIVVAGLGLAGAAALPTPTAAQAQAAKAPASDKELQTFATVTKEVDGINREYREKMKAAPADKQKLQLEALDVIAKRIEAKGMTVARYIEIAEIVKADPAARDKVKAFIAQ